MNFFIYPDKFDPCHLHFGPIMENNIHKHATNNPNQNPDVNAKFSRITYSTKHISLNNVGIVLHLHSVKQVHAFHHSGNHVNKLMVSYDELHPTNASIVKQLKQIECAIIDKYVHNALEPGETRRCVHSIEDILKTGHLKVCSHRCEDYDFANPESHVFNEDEGCADACDMYHGNAVVVIFGVWETPTECGLVHKFVKQ